MAMNMAVIEYIQFVEVHKDFTGNLYMCCIKQRTLNVEVVYVHA
jgi:hypothetical protein